MDFILANYANPDVIAHTGNYNAAIEAVKVIDEAIGKITQTILSHENTTLIVTADHGNLEQILNPLSGLPETQHNTSPVPIYVVASELKKERNQPVSKTEGFNPIGILADIAPTILELMDIPKPAEMTGESLLGKLN